MNSKQRGYSSSSWNAFIECDTSSFAILADIFPYFFRPLDALHALKEGEGARRRRRRRVRRGMRIGKN